MIAAGSHIARTNLFYFGTLALLSARGIVLIPLLLRVWGPEGYGTYVLALSVISYGIVIAQAGLDTSLYQYLTQTLETERARLIFWTAIETAAAWIILLAIGGIMGAGLIGGTSIALFGLACACIVLGQVMFGLSITPIRCREQTALYLTIIAAVGVGDFALTVIVSIHTGDLTVTFFGLALYYLVVGVTALIWQAREFSPIRWSRAEFRPLASYGLNGVLNQLVISGYFVWDRTIVSLAAGVAAVAAFAPGMALAGIILPIASISVFTLPTLLARRAVRESAAMQRALLRQATRQYALLAVPACAGLIIVAKPFLTLITSVALAETGAPVAQLAAGAVLASGLARFAILALRADGDDSWVSRNLLFQFGMFVVCAGGFSALWPERAPIIVAGAMLISNVSQAVFAYSRLARRVSGSIAPSVFLSPCFGVLGFFWLPWLIEPNSVPTLALLVAAAIAIYVVVIMVMERQSPTSLLRHLRTPAMLPEVLGTQRLSLHDRSAVILYAGPNHLFVAAGMFYAIELAEKFIVHVFVHCTPGEDIPEPVYAALHRHGIRVHFIPEARWIAKHEINNDIAARTMDETDPVAVFLNNDMGEFNVVLARLAKQQAVPVICFQTGAINKGFRLDYIDYTINVLGTVLARDSGLPVWLGRALMVLRMHAWHYWHYYLGPILAGYAPYPGTSSIYLRRGHTCQRDGDLYLCYEPGAPRIAIADGTPAERLIPFRHPLLRPAGRKLFEEVFPPPPPADGLTALVLVDLPEQGVDAPDAFAPVIEAVVGLAAALSRSYRQILVKPHPGMARWPALLTRLKEGLAHEHNAVVLDPAVNAVSLLSTVRIVVGETSSVLKLARYFPGTIIVSTTYAAKPRDIFHASPAGLHLFPTWREAVKVDLAALKPVGDDPPAPEGASTEGIVDLLSRCCVLQVAPKAIETARAAEASNC